MRLHDTITRLRATGSSDGYGNTTADWSGTLNEVDLPAEVQPAGSTEDVVDQARTTTRWRLWLFADADLTASDRVRWDGQVYEVDGDVETWKRRGAPHHLEALLMKVTQR